MSRYASEILEPAAIIRLTWKCSDSEHIGKVRVSEKSVQTYDDRGIYISNVKFEELVARYVRISASSWTRGKPIRRKYL